MLGGVVHVTFLCGHEKTPLQILDTVLNQTNKLVFFDVFKGNIYLSEIN